MGARELRRWWCFRGLALATLAGFAVAASGAAELPLEHDCPAVAGSSASDPAPMRLREGMVLSRAEALRLAQLLPPEVWRHRDAFLPDGMQMVIGACHRRYPVPRYFRIATERFARHVELDANGNLTGYTAGLPFPPGSIDPDAADAGMRWAWNFELRHRGAGPSGRFRITESRGDGAQTATGSWFQLQLAYRADLAQTEYRVAEAPPAAWIAGGRFTEPAGARGLAWLQTRERAAARQFTMPDDVFVFVPSLAKVRRAASPWIDGLYLPSHRALGRDTGMVGPGGAIASGAAAVTENRARGLLGLSVRPNAYVWRVLGTKQVIAPLNASRGGFPGEPARNFGPSGLSLASDRWDVREAVAIQGALREGGREYDWLTLYIDTQTQQPLYVITERRRDRRRIGVGILLHRFSGDQPGYPAWPDGQPAAVFDPAAAVFFDESDGSGWRRESYDARSAPLPADELRYRTTSAFLERAR